MSLEKAIYLFIYRNLHAIEQASVYMSSPTLRVL